MPVAVLDLDLADLPPRLQDLGDYHHALVLLRISGQPVGQAIIPLVDGGCVHLREELLAQADSSFWEAWLRNRLDLDPPKEPEPPRITATVAVCTRDRTEDLRRCIAALLAMPDDGQEILIVDNAPSTEDTKALVSGFPAVRYVREDRPGLDNARNRALHEASGEIIAFTDDDAAPDRLWLRCLLRNFADPQVLAATGPTMPLELETSAQIDFQRYGGFLRGFKRVVYDAHDKDPLLAWHAGAGVNMALRRSVADRVGLFDEALDAGTPTQAGGDSDMFRRILSAGYRIAYDPQALNWHRHRRWQAELNRQLYGYEVAASAQLCKALVLEGQLGTVAAFLGWAHRELRGLAASALRRPGAAPLGLAAARFKGGAVGAFAYLSARRG